MARMPDAIDSLTPEAQKVYDKIVARRGKLRGPYAPLMHDPPLAEPVADLGEYLRFKSTLPGDVREMAILVVARHVSQPFEWWAHAPIARREGLAEEVIQRIHARGDLAALPPKYADAARVVRHVLEFETIPADLHARVQKTLGVSGLMELVVLAGYYRLIAGVLFAFDVPLPEGERPVF
jgi:4-carboxymuconolactone decarboxylase